MIDFHVEKWLKKYKTIFLGHFSSEKQLGARSDSRWGSRRAGKPARRTLKSDPEAKKRWTKWTFHPICTL